MNSIFLLLRLVAPILFLTSLAILYLFFPDRLSADRVFLVTSLIFSFALAFLSQAPIVASRSHSDASAVGKIGVAGYLSVIFLIIATAGLYFSIEGSEKLAIASDILSAAFFLLSMSLTKFTELFLSGHSDRYEFNGKHNLWGVRLRQIAMLAKDSGLARRLNELADEAVYLARDISAGDSEINNRISEKINTIQSLVENSDSEKALVACGEYQNLVASRELNLKQLRSKA